MKRLWTWLASLGVMAASLGSVACMILLVDEPKMPKSMIK